MHHLLGRIPELAFSVSATTREKRSGEEEGRDYYFIAPEVFRRKIADNEFLEWEKVYENGYYGTLRSEINRISRTGRVAVFDVDVEGGLKIKSAFRNSLLDVFVRPPGIEELRRRLVARETESAESLEARVQKAGKELTYADHFSHTIINRDFDEASLHAEKLVKAFLSGVPQEGNR